MKVCAFYTNDKYKRLAERMKASAEALGLSVHLKEYPEVPAWSAALRIKVVFIGEMLNSQTEDILYLDADTWVERRPDVLLTPGDFDIGMGYVLPGHPHGCAMFFRNNVKVKALQKRWLEMFDLYPGIKLDETLLEYTILEFKRQGLIVKTLPPAYGWMEYMKPRFPGAVPIIHHLGAGEGSDKREVFLHPTSPYREVV